jgi:hypothetical protein
LILQFQTLDSLHGFPQILLIHLNPDEVETQTGRGQRTRAEAQKRIEHDPGAAQAVQADALFGDFFGK